MEKALLFGRVFE